MNKIDRDIDDLRSLLFERRQILALIGDTKLWCQIPLEQRIAIVESSEFLLLMGESFTNHSKQMLENEIEAMFATIH